jgi:ankyrin repeat protein
LINAFLLLQDDYERTPLILASFKGRKEIAKLLIEHGALVDERVTSENVST